jgi:tetratricopeptide (TPR) repeat protein
MTDAAIKESREKASTLKDKGGDLRKRGDLAGALINYSEARVVLDTLLTVHPNFPSRQLVRAQVVDALTTVAGLQDAMGNLAGAETSYAAALAIVRDKRSLRELFDCLRSSGELRQRRKDFAGALALFDEGRDVAVQWLPQEPTNVQMRIHLASFHVHIADVWRDRGDQLKAKASFDDARRLLGELLESYPTDPYELALLGSAMHLFGVALKDAGELEQSLVALDRARVIRARLVESDASRLHAQVGLALTYWRLAEANEARGNRTEAVGFAALGLEIDERLAASDPTNANWVNAARGNRDTLDRLRAGSATQSTDL